MEPKFDTENCSDKSQCLTMDAPKSSSAKVLKGDFFIISEVLLSELEPK